MKKQALNGAWKGGPVLTRDDIAEMLKDRIGSMSARAWARQEGTSHTDVSDVLKGTRWPKKKLREILGIETARVYWRKR